MSIASTSRIRRTLLAGVVFGAPVLVGYGGALIPPEPEAFVGTWTCEANTAQGEETQELLISLDRNLRRAGDTGIRVLTLWDPGCYAAFAVVGETATTLQSCEQLL